MCGRVNVSDLEGLDELIASIIEHTTRPQAPDVAEPAPTARIPRWNVAPTRSLDAVTRDRSIVRMHWGIKAPWKGTQPPLINARSESVFDKPSFREHARTRRCILPINGFYEWQRSARQRHAYYIRPCAGPGLLVAGIWAPPAGSEQPLPALCLLTRAADSHFTDIHDRMPVMLTPTAARRWMSEDDLCEHAIQEPSKIELAVERVGDYVNSARNEGPECLAPPRNLPLF